MNMAKKTTQPPPLKKQDDLLADYLKLFYSAAQDGIDCIADTTANPDDKLRWVNKIFTDIQSYLSENNPYAYPLNACTDCGKLFGKPGYSDCIKKNC